jgi:hypothetical protein
VSDGKVEVGYIDPAMVEAVVTHPMNARIRRMVIVTWVDGSKRALRIIQPSRSFVTDGDGGKQVVVSQDYEGMLTTWAQDKQEQWEIDAIKKLTGRNGYSGDVFYEPFNAFSNQPRGISDMAVISDWLDQADAVLFQLCNREGYANYFSFDVEIDSADDQVIKDRAKELKTNPPEHQSVNVHGSSEKWKVMSPDLKQAGHIQTFRTVLGFILGGMGYPVHWFGFGDDANRATATVQTSPTEKSLKNDQACIERLIINVCQFVIDQWLIASKSKAHDGAITVSMPEISKRSIKDAGANFVSFVSAIITAMVEDVMTEDVAIQIVHQLASSFGIDYDIEEERKRLKQLKAERGTVLSDMDWDAQIDKLKDEEKLVAKTSLNGVGSNE